MNRHTLRFLRAGVTALAATALVATGGSAEAASAPSNRRTVATLADSAPVKQPGPRSERAVRGVPVNPKQHVLTQPDGRKIVARRHGDSARNWWTSNGATIAKDKTGTWRYATALDAKGQPAAAGAPVSDAAPAPKAAKGLKPSRDAVAVPTNPVPQGASALTNVGSQKTVVILAQFSNRSSVGSTPAQWASSFFGSTNSVRAYYKVASYNKLDVAPAAETSGAADGVIGWVTLPMTHPNYGADVGASAQQVTAEAIKAANPYIDYLSYDTNGDGVISPNELHITVIAAGYEASYAGQDASCAPNLWAHQWSLSTPPTVDGVRVGGQGYTQFGESHCEKAYPGEAHRATIGVMAHEFGHDLGWPDLYDTDFSSEGVGDWSLMASGAWGTKPGSQTPGDAPILPDAWSKYVQGWINPTPITGTSTVAVGQAAIANSTYRLLDNPGGAEYNWRTGGTGEYFLVENRQPTGLDIALPGCGLLVYHVDETRRDNDNDGARLVDVEEADGNNGLDRPRYVGSAADPWHGVLGQTSFNSSSTPNSFTNAGASTPAAMTATGGCASTMNATLSAGPTGPSAGTFVPVAPARDLDTRTTTKVAANQAVDVQVTGRNGVPIVSQVDAVVLNVTAVQPTVSGYATVFPAGTTRPTASNLNFRSGVTATANLVIAKVGATGAVTIHNGSSGGTHYLADVVGYYLKAGAPAGSKYTPTSPRRILDTRTASALGAAQTRTLTVAGGTTGVPSNATGVVMNVTATNTTASSYLTVYPNGRSRPTASNLNWPSGTAAIANLVYTPVGTNGQVRLYNSAGSTHLLADVVGWFGPSGQFVYHPTAPKRIVDTRVPLGVPAKARLGAARTMTVDLTGGTTGIPDDAKAVVVNTTAANTTAGSYLTVWPAGNARPTASSLNWAAGQTVPNLVFTVVGSGGATSVYNSAGVTDVIMDLGGWYGL
ncbi:M6 family metalloprotease domain-containing protein [Yimella sp. cx-573]|nr:M6 family metalloprotease domain-containing protein [Yimella sp. cx-573]